LALVVAAGCTAREVGDGDGGGGDTGSTSAATNTEGASLSGVPTSGDDAPATTAVDGSGGGESGPPPPTTCADGSDFAATAELIDSGLGPTGAAVTVLNCTDVEALVQQDCCFGAAYQLERRDADSPRWAPTDPAVACDCKGPVDPLVVEPMGQISFETNPSGLDAEPVCAVGSVEYRYILEIARSDCADCWQSVTTTAFDWYCEG
jgi:hypothetical protein